MKNEAPERIPNRRKKVEKLYLMQGCNCAIAQESGEVAIPTDLHHAGVPNTRLNRIRFPRFVHSLWNLKFVNHLLHLGNGSFGRISLREAGRREAFLVAHPCIAKKLNCEVEK